MSTDFIILQNPLWGGYLAILTSRPPLKVSGAEDLRWSPGKHICALIFNSTHITGAQSRLKPMPSSMQDSELSSVEDFRSKYCVVPGPRSIQITSWLPQDNKVMVAIIYLSFGLLYFLNFQKPMCIIL